MQRVDGFPFGSLLQETPLGFPGPARTAPAGLWAAQALGFHVSEAFRAVALVGVPCAAGCALTPKPPRH